MNPDGSAPEVFATGFRNPYDLTFTPDGDLFTADTAPNQLNRTLRFLPPEELDYVQADQDYGFPHNYGDLIPAGEDSLPPVTEFYPGVGTAGLTYYAGDGFPAQFRNGIFLALRGSDAMSAIDPLNGFAVVFIPLTKDADGSYSGDWQPFIQFNQGLDPLPSPVDVTVGPDGALYIAEWNSGDIYRVIYTGPREEPAE